MPVIVKADAQHPFLPSLASHAAIEAERARHQDIRPLEILVVNLMADKIGTERQLAQWLGKPSLQVHLTFTAIDGYIDDIRAGRHTPSNTPAEHIEHFYSRFSDIRANKYDGVIITGVNAREPDLTQEPIWPQVRDILDWTETNATASLFLCWGAQAALKHFYGINRQRQAQKTYGVFDHHILSDKTDLLDGFADVFQVPVSRWNEISADDIKHNPELELTAASPQAGVGIITEPRAYDNGIKHYPYRTFILNHPEYETETLAGEYQRDAATDPAYPLPAGYFLGDQATSKPLNTWRHTGQIYANWVNLVYDATPFDLAQIPLPFTRPADTVTEELRAAS